MSETLVSWSARDLSAPPFLLSIGFPLGRIAVQEELDRHQVHLLASATRVLGHSPAACWPIDVAAITFCEVAGRAAWWKGSSSRLAGAIACP